MLLGLLPFSAMAENANAADITGDNPADAGSVAPVTDPFADATTIYVSNTGGGDGTSETTPTTLKEAVAQINNATQDGDKVPAFIISLTEDLNLNNTIGDDYTLTKYSTMLLGNTHKIESEKKHRRNR